MKKFLSIVLILSMTLGAVSCTPGLNDRIKVEDQLSKLTQAGDNIWINDDKEYEAMVNSLLYITNDTETEGCWLVATDDDIIFASGNGIMDNDGNTVDPFTTFEIGSMSKSFVSVCIFKLAEEGKISLDDTLGDFFPEYSSCPNFEATSKVTISDMLHMRSGIPDYLNTLTDFWDENTIRAILGSDADELLRTGDQRSFFDTPGSDEYFLEQLGAITDEELFMENVFTCEPYFEPGEDFFYSNTNYYILATIIEHITGKAYQDLVKEVVFDPCNMTGTSSMAFGDVEASLPEGAFYFRPEYSKGAGDIHSNVVDILKYDRALFGGYLLKAESLETMITPIDFYACGFEIQDGVVSHGGDTPACASGHYIIERNGQHLYVIGWSHQGSRNGILNLIGQQFDPKPKSNRSIYIVIGSSAAVIGIVACVIVHGKKKESEGADKAASE